VAASSIDNSLKVFSLHEGDGAGIPHRSSLLSEASGEDAQAWKIDFTAEN